MLQRHTDFVKDQEVAPTVHFEPVKRRDRLIPTQLPIHLCLIRQKAYFISLGHLALDKLALAIRKEYLLVRLARLRHLLLDGNFLARQDVETRTDGACK